MRDTLAHRGPDDVGVYVGPEAALGFRRLSIIDLHTGHQPMTNDARDVWVAFNGEIYNFPELRRDLEARGHKFTTTSDTECLVHGYEEYGDELVEMLNGMFAIGLWDDKRKRLLLARDRAGEKPLHYLLTTRGLIFASEIKALLQHPSASRDIDWAAFDEYMTFGFVSAPRTIYRSIHKVPPGHYLVYERGQVRLQNYWKINLDRQFAGTYRDACDECFKLLNDAVRIRMVSDVPLGAFLSGGIDSSSVVALMARNASTPVRTFSIGFNEAEYDETRFADVVSRAYGTQHVRLVVTPDYRTHLEDVLLNFDEPFGDSSALPTYLVARLTREHVTVALSGDGGDELFGGYQTYRKLLLFQALLRYVPTTGRRALARLGGWLPLGVRLLRRLHLASATENERFLRIATHFDDAEKAALYTDTVKDAVNNGAYASSKMLEVLERGNGSYASGMQLADFMLYLPDDILVKVDRTSMLVSLEARAPFLDHRLVEFAFSLPASWKVTPTRSKIILRDALRGVLPKPVRQRGKMGFALPVREWLASSLHPYLRECLSEPSLARVFQRRAIDRMLEDHRTGRRDHTNRLWFLLCFALWASRNRTSF
jgi:asparagine synthase (glutamine-hydrolysing)